MDHVKIYHNPYCGSSVNAVKIADELGVPAEIIIYQRTPPDRDELVWLLRRLNEEWGTAVVLAEHRLERCLAHADRVVVRVELERARRGGVLGRRRHGDEQEEQCEGCPYAHDVRSKRVPTP